MLPVLQTEVVAQSLFSDQSLIYKSRVHHMKIRLALK
jgi:hypothetical protein